MSRKPPADCSEQLSSHAAPVGVRIERHLVNNAISGLRVSGDISRDVPGNFRAAIRHKDNALSRQESPRKPLLPRGTLLRCRCETRVKLADEGHLFFPQIGQGGRDVVNDCGAYFHRASVSL